MTILHCTIQGFSIAYQTWGNPEKPTILALHGWLDNANSFAPLASYLSHEFYIIAIDLPGHGHSSHLPTGCHYHFLDGIFIVLEIMNALQLDQVHLLGHSMGACLASLVAGVMPERMLSLMLIEGLAPFSHPEETACRQLRDYAHFLSQKGKPSKGYESLERAAFVRASKDYVSLESARILCQRALIEKEGLFYWRHDKRLVHPSPLRMTETQIHSCLQQITAKTYLITANDGFSFDNEIMQNRIKVIPHLIHQRVNGRHHVHMEQPEAIAQLLTDFIF